MCAISRVVEQNTFARGEGCKGSYPTFKRQCANGLSVFHAAILQSSVADGRHNGCSVTDTNRK